MNKLTRSWIINGEQVTVQFEPLARLLDVLRDYCGLISLKEGCGEGECGACSLMINDQVHLACLTAAAQVDDDSRVMTAEGLERTDLGRALQQAFAKQGAVQCGYCTPGMLIGSFALLTSNSHPSLEEIRRNLAGHLCRCTGYTKIFDAVQTVAKECRQP